MANAVEIANFALARLGAQRIQSLSDTDNENAILANIHYEQVVKSTLREHPWNCCRTRDDLARLADAPPFEFSYAYQLPIGFLRAIYVNDEDALSVRDKWRIESDQLLSDDTSIELVYIYYEEDAEKYDALLVDAITVKLAARLAGPITGNPRIGAEYLREYEEVTKRLAMRIDASEDSSNENHPLLTHLTRSPLGMRRRTSPLG